MCEIIVLVCQQLEMCVLFFCVCLWNPSPLWCKYFGPFLSQFLIHTLSLVSIFRLNKLFAIRLPLSRYTSLNLSLFFGYTTLISMCSARDTSCLPYLMSLTASGLFSLSALAVHMADRHAWTHCQCLSLSHFHWPHHPLPIRCFVGCRNLGFITWRRFGQAIQNR